MPNYLWLSQSLKALQNRHLTPAQGREKKKILGCNTPNPDFEKAMTKRMIVFDTFRA